MITAKILTDSLFRNIDLEKGIQDFLPGLEIWQSTVGGAKFKTFIEIEKELTPEFGDNRIQPDYLFLFVGTNELSIRDYPDKNYDNEKVFSRVRGDIETLIKWYENAKRIFLVMPIARFDNSEFKLKPYINWMKENIKLANVDVVEFSFEFKIEHFKLDGLHLHVNFQSEFQKLAQKLIVNNIFEYQKQNYLEGNCEYKLIADSYSFFRIDNTHSIFLLCDPHAEKQMIPLHPHSFVVKLNPPRHVF